MSPNPRGLANASTKDLILSNFPEQGNELVGNYLNKYLDITATTNENFHLKRFLILGFNVLRSLRPS